MQMNVMMMPRDILEKIVKIIISDNSICADERTRYAVIGTCRTWRCIAFPLWFQDHFWECISHPRQLVSLCNSPARITFSLKITSSGFEMWQGPRLLLKALQNGKQCMRIELLDTVVGLIRFNLSRTSWNFVPCLTSRSVVTTYRKRKGYALVYPDIDVCETERLNVLFSVRNLLSPIDIRVHDGAGDVVLSVFPTFQNGIWVLPFREHRIIPSKKNFQLVGNVMELGKLSTDVFIGDFDPHRFTARQVFMIAISTIYRKFFFYTTQCFSSFYV